MLRMTWLIYAGMNCILGDESVHFESIYALVTDGDFKNGSRQDVAGAIEALNH